MSSFQKQLQIFNSEVSDRLLEAVKGAEQDTQDSPDECTEGKVFLLDVVGFEARLLSFGDDGLTEVEHI